MRTLKLLLFVLVALWLVACAPATAPAPAPAPEKVVTQVVSVKETVVVAGTPQVVEKVVTATPRPTATPNTQPQRGGTLNMSLGPDFATLDPYRDFEGREFKPLVFDSPIRFSDKGDFEPWLAESYEMSKDGKAITLRMRKGVMFHNGREMKADDVIYSISQARDATLGHDLTDRFKTCTGATKIDDYTVQINYSDITPGAWDALAALYIYPKEAADKIKTVAVGTGPFKFQEWVPGDHLTLVRFDNYWRKGEPYFDKVNIKPIPDDQARMVNLLAGAIDLLGRAPQSSQDLLAQSPGIVLTTQPPGFAFDAFIINIAKPPFDNPSVRQAVNYTVDRAKINKLAYFSRGAPTLLPLPSTSWAYPKDLENYYTYDLDKAKALLAKAGYPNGFETEILTRGTTGIYVDTAQVWQQDLAKVGIKLKITPMDNAAYLPRLTSSDFTIVSHGTGASSVDPTGTFQAAACCRPFRNFFQIEANKDWFPKYSAAIQAGDTAVDQDKRKAAYRDVISIYLEQGWTIALSWRQWTYASKDFLKGIRVDMDGKIWLNTAWFAK
jgi:peptide/nickel transport system substrate-binding protein